MHFGRHVREHRFREIERDDRGRGRAFAKNAGEASLAAANVGDALAREIAKMIEHQLDVQNARVDGRRVMLLIARGIVEESADLGGRGARRAFCASREPAHPKIG